jgi:hypothetical protein
MHNGKCYTGGRSDCEWLAGILGIPLNAIFEANEIHGRLSAAIDRHIAGLTTQCKVWQVQTIARTKRRNMVQTAEVLAVRKRRCARRKLNIGCPPGVIYGVRRLRNGTIVVEKSTALVDRTRPQFATSEAIANMIRQGVGRCG